MDIGEYLGTGAHLESLKRTASGIFTLDNAATIDEIKEYINGSCLKKKFLFKPVEALINFSSIKINNIIRNKVLNGAFFPESDIISINNKGSNPFTILDEEENLIAIANVDINNWSINYLNVFN